MSSNPWSDIPGRRIDGELSGAELAQFCVGKRLIACLRFEDAAGQLERRVQLLGQVASHEGSDLVVELEGSRTGSQARLPTRHAHLWEAHPGIYQLDEHGEQVVDPDLVGLWVLRTLPS